MSDELQQMQDGGYFREDGEDAFPWHATERAVWYALITTENGAPVRHGFRASKSSKTNLLQALRAVSTAGRRAMLLGVWNGQYHTHLFDLRIDRAIEKLSAVIEVAR